VRAEFGRAGHIVSANPGLCFLDRASPQASNPNEEGTPLERVAVILRHETVSGPNAVLLSQDVENIASPFTRPALSVFLCDISDQVGETALAAAQTGDDCRMVHHSKLSPCHRRCLRTGWLSVKPSFLLEYAFSCKNSNRGKKRRNFFFFAGLI
jgi:hypothetical protein